MERRFRHLFLKANYFFFFKFILLSYFENQKLYETNLNLKKNRSKKVTTPSGILFFRIFFKKSILLFTDLGYNKRAQSRQSRDSWRLDRCVTVGIAARRDEGRKRRGRGTADKRQPGLKPAGPYRCRAGVEFRPRPMDRLPGLNPAGP